MDLSLLAPPDPVRWILVSENLFAGELLTVLLEIGVTNSGDDRSFFLRYDGLIIYSLNLRYITMS